MFGLEIFRKKAKATNDVFWVLPALILTHQMGHSGSWATFSLENSTLVKIGVLILQIVTLAFDRGNKQVGFAQSKGGKGQ